MTNLAEMYAGADAAGRVMLLPLIRELKAKATGGY